MHFHRVYTPPKEYHDHDIDSGSPPDKEDARHITKLTPEELVWEKKLKRNVDSPIMVGATPLLRVNFG
ncbi:hypothetical protein D0864_08331 [Hortaea werneckii]|uniref:Uncharacterized protein n=1 Tax=Hortaea werneckii TaxID=91943 RepID=A0A3M7EXQ7_HORWE|nr:hypothetical protein D0864_08331 [Hortaea werneckii]